VRLKLYAIPGSHPCEAVEVAMKLKRLDYQRVDLPPGLGQLNSFVRFGKRTVPALRVDSYKVVGSRLIMRVLDGLRPEPALLPHDAAAHAAVEEAERWGDEELQDLGRRLPWGALHFRPEAMGTFAGPGAPPLDPPGTDFAMKFIHASWKYHKITAARLAEDLAGLPGKLDRIDAYVAEGILAGETPNAADLQIGATIAVLLTVGDLRPLIEGRPGEQVARKWFDDRPGLVPAGAFPASWMP
jgi:glutathione S-transferase